MPCTRTVRLSSQSVRVSAANDVNALASVGYVSVIVRPTVRHIDWALVSLNRVKFTLFTKYSSYLQAG